jgi:hypothetical protein
MKTITIKFILDRDRLGDFIREWATTLQMMHRGLVPGVGCYERCKSGWDLYVATAC